MTSNERQEVESGVPDELKARRQWVLWRATRLLGNQEITWVQAAWLESYDN